ncbi:MAG: T9SS type A sorting domain-containing protein, partial [Bacteroidetes bacterium]|jgi:hypothetical protein|nr:T9SS type A sorting domain-containing protein [Bacteroidota bacterium]
VGLGEAARAAADVSGDGDVDTQDAQLIRNFVEDVIACFPVEPGCAGNADLGQTAASQGNHATHTDTAEADDAPPQTYQLGSSYPNPSNPSTQIPYALPERSRVRLVIYNALGQRVRTLVDREQGAGPHRARWDGRAEDGRPVASGVYFYRLEAEASGSGGGRMFVQTRPLTLVQ